MCFSSLITFDLVNLNLLSFSFTEQYKVVGPADSVFAVAGEDVILPCSVKPNITVGRPPVITVDGFDHSGGLHLQCESEGWNPEPDLEWLASAGVTLSSETTEKHRKTEGFSVKHTITLHHSDKIHCRVKLRHHMLEALIITTSNMFISWRTPIILISVFVVLSMIAGILIAVFVHKNKGNILLVYVFYVCGHWSS
uniref:Zgc:123297 n=1 Tax=Sinocyclocheilus anshuiensis TaxID=1608454 RepID=A0A671RVD4_9TELE